MSVHLVIGPREPVELELRRGCRRHADGSLSNLGKPHTYRAILDEIRVEHATFSEAPYLLAEIQVVHDRRIREADEARERATRKATLRGEVVVRWPRGAA